MQITVLYVKMLETYDATATLKENQCFAPLQVAPPDCVPGRWLECWESSWTTLDWLEKTCMSNGEAFILLDKQRKNRKTVNFFPCYRDLTGQMVQKRVYHVILKGTSWDNSAAESAWGRQLDDNNAEPPVAPLRCGDSSPWYTRHKAMHELKWISLLLRSQFLHLVHAF